MDNTVKFLVCQYSEDDFVEIWLLGLCISPKTYREQVATKQYMAVIRIFIKKKTSLWRAKARSKMGKIKTKQNANLHKTPKKLSETVIIFSKVEGSYKDLKKKKIYEREVSTWRREFWGTQNLAGLFLAWK